MPLMDEGSRYRLWSRYSCPTTQESLLTWTGYTWHHHTGLNAEGKCSIPAAVGPLAIHEAFSCGATTTRLQLGGSVSKASTSAHQPPLMRYELKSAVHSEQLDRQSRFIGTVNEIGDLMVMSLRLQIPYEENQPDRSSFRCTVCSMGPMSFCERSRSLQSVCEDLCFTCGSDTR
nr:hypothetical protein CFP56_65174 [Quercus suber]